MHGFAPVFPLQGEGHRVLGGLLGSLLDSGVCWVSGVALGGPGAPASPAGSAAPARSLPSSHLPRRAPHARPPTPSSPPRPSHTLLTPGRANPAPPARGIGVHPCCSPQSPRGPGTAGTRPLCRPAVPVASLTQTSPALLAQPHRAAKNPPAPLQST